MATGIQLGFMSEMIRQYIHPANTIPFVNDALCFWISIISGAVAIAVGFWQTTWESGRGTFQFLLHRPVNRGAIIGTKLLLGGLLCMAMALAPVFSFALWAATPGTHASPFFWSMTTSSWRFSAIVPLVYLGAFISGCALRGGSQAEFFPLFGAILIASLLLTAASTVNASSLVVGWLILLVGVMAMGAILYCRILRQCRSGQFS